MNPGNLPRRALPYLAFVLVALVLRLALDSLLPSVQTSSVHAMEQVEFSLRLLTYRDVAINLVAFPLALLVASRFGNIGLVPLLALVSVYWVTVWVVNMWALNQLTRAFGETFFSVSGVLGYEHWPMTVIGFAGTLFATCLAYLLVAAVAARFGR